MRCGRNNFVFVVSALDYGTHRLAPEVIFDALIGRSMWLLTEWSPHRKRMSSGDRVLFYFAGNKRRHFVADGAIETEPRDMTQAEQHAAQELGLLDFALTLPLTRVRRWAAPVPISPLYDDLEFIKDPRYPGHQLRRGVIRISDPDYALVLSARKQASSRSQSAEA